MSGKNYKFGRHVEGMLTETLLAFGTLFTIVNPFSTAFVFNKLAKGKSTGERKRIALRASLYAVAFLFLFLILGNAILTFFGITIYAFRVAGGLYLAWVGFEMLAPHLRRHPENYDDAGDAIAVIPLAIPLLSGPGALTSVLVLTADFPWPPVALAILIVGLISWLVLREAKWFDRVIGRIGTLVIERVLGLIVLVIAVQFVFNGVTGYLLAIGLI